MKSNLWLGIGIGVVLVLFFISQASPQQQTGSMMGGSMPMGWPMLVFMGLFWVLLLILMVLSILWLIKQLRQ